MFVGYLVGFWLEKKKEMYVLNGKNGSDWFFLLVILVVVEDIEDDNLMNVGILKILLGFLIIVFSVWLLWFFFMVMMNGSVLILRSNFLNFFNGFLFLFDVCFLLVIRMIFFLVLDFVVFWNK